VALVMQGDGRDGPRYPVVATRAVVPRIHSVPCRPYSGRRRPRAAQRRQRNAVSAEGIVNRWRGMNAPRPATG
jgi:hypothetical protein